MDKEQFDSLYFGKAVHCDTEEKANEFLTLADSVGYKWVTEMEVSDNTFWKVNKKRTCYRIAKDGILCTKMNYFIEQGYQIIEYELQPIKKGK